MCVRESVPVCACVCERESVCVCVCNRERRGKRKRDDTLRLYQQSDNVYSQ